MRTTISLLALLVSASASPAFAAPVTATEAVQTKRLALETNRQRQMYRAKSFQDVKAVFQEYGYNQTGQTGERAQEYTNPGSYPGVGLGGGGGESQSSTYAAAVNSLNLEFNARASNDQRAIENYRAQQQADIAANVQHMQNAIASMQQAQATQQAEIRAAYEERKAYLTATMDNASPEYASAIALLNSQFAADYSAVASTYGPSIQGYKGALESILQQAQTRVNEYANSLNNERNAEYQNRLLQLQQQQPGPGSNN